MGIKNKKRKKIIFFHPYFMNGGVERSIIENIKYLEKYYDIHIVSILFTNHYINELKKRKISLHILKKKRLIYSFFEYKKIINKTKPNLIISFQTYANVFCLAAKLFFNMDIKVLCSERLSILSLKENFKGNVIIYLYKVFSYFAAGFICISKGLKTELEKILNIRKEKIHLAYNSTFRKEIDLLSKKKININFFNKRDKFIVSLGRLEKVKNHLMLLKAFKISSEKIKNLKLLIVGDGSNKINLLQYIKKNNLQKKVKIINFNKNPFPYIKKANLVVHTANYEGLCNVIIESLFLKKFVISTNCPVGPSELISKGIGFLVEVNNHKMLSKKIIFFFKNKIKFKKQNLNRLLKILNPNINNLKLRKIIEMYI